MDEAVMTYYIQYIMERRR